MARLKAICFHCTYHNVLGKLEDLSKLGNFLRFINRILTKACCLENYGNLCVFFYVSFSMGSAVKEYNTKDGKIIQKEWNCFMRKSEGS